jgi:hypothetical protein
LYTSNTLDFRQAEEKDGVETVRPPVGVMVMVVIVDVGG